MDLHTCIWQPMAILWALFSFSLNVKKWISKGVKCRTTRFRVVNHSEMTDYRFCDHNINSFLSESFIDSLLFDFWVKIFHSKMCWPAFTTLFHSFTFRDLFTDYWVSKKCARIMPSFEVNNSKCYVKPTLLSQMNYF